MLTEWQPDSENREILKQLVRRPFLLTLKEPRDEAREMEKR